MRIEDLGDFRSIGSRKDGALVIVTAEVHGTTNIFELVECDSCRHLEVRDHDAEAYRKEQEKS